MKTASTSMIPWGRTWKKEYLIQLNPSTIYLVEVNQNFFNNPILIFGSKMLWIY